MPLTRGKIKVLDAAYWMKGCRSLGRLRCAAQLRIGEGAYKDGGLCLIDIKEAIKAAAVKCPQRNVVEGAHERSPFLGDRMLAAKFLDRDLFIRELLPQDLKLELDQLTRTGATSAVQYLAAVIGKAQVAD